MGLSQPFASVYTVVLTSLIVMPEFNPNNNQIFLNGVLGVAGIFVGFWEPLQDTPVEISKPCKIELKNTDVDMDFLTSFVRRNLRSHEIL
jgi:hypothetical protein